MKRSWMIASVSLAASGVLAFYLVPVVWRQEPLLTFRLGIGAALCVLLVSSSILVLLIALAYGYGHDQAAQRVNRERDDSHRRFLRRLDHELKNPLTGLQTAIINLRESQSSEETLQAVENARLATDRLGYVLGDLRKLGQLEAQLLERRPVDLGGLAEEMMNAACSLPAHQGRNINVMVSKVPAPPCALGDRDMLGLAVYNLIDNALKYSAAQDAIEVLVHADGNAAFIEIADGGAGIPLDEQLRIFEELYRGENARETEGSGLGLPLVRRIAQLHGGDVSMRSDPAHGHGSVFILRLPAE